MNTYETHKAMKPRIISLFSGCGGMDLGFHREGYRTIWANDNNKWAVDSFRNYFGDVIEADDITEIDPYGGEVPNGDLILGGFPCQDFSVIWKQPGLNGARGNLYKEFLRFVDAKKPKAFVAENVKGLLSANNRLAVQQIIKDFEQITPGYVVKVQLYNFADYGVPQFRERVIFVGVRMDTGFEFIHPQPTHGPGRRHKFVTTQQALKGVKKVKHNNEKMNIAEKTREMLKLIPEGRNFAYLPKNHPLYVKGMISHVYRRIDRTKPSSTIIAAGGGGTWGYHHSEPRPLTNRERARLQTFPDDFIFFGSNAEVRRQIGNAVPPEGIRPVARRLKALFENNYEPVDLKHLSQQLKRLSLKERLLYDTGRTPMRLDL